MNESTHRSHLLRATTQDPANARLLQRRHSSGALVRLLAGVYIAAEEWEALSSAGRHLTRARAIAPRLRPGSVFSHVTAALIHGWPLVENAPDRVHVVDPAVPVIQHRAGLVRHPSSVPPRTAAVAFDGVPVTAPLDTATALITTGSPHAAAVPVDAAIRQGTVALDDLRDAVPVRPARGSVRAETVISALDARHESVGESFAAIRFVQLGLPRCEPQVEFRHRDGTVDRVDFWFPSLGVVVEFDGRQKYVDPSMLQGRDPADVLWAEKRREDRLRALPAVRAVIRVTWWHLVEPDRLLALFRSHGILV
ncbi:hypothetical protein [Curtobacterium aurantiacum]|uniref:hypothetical protein n=1 Tax=Curtobacterium aurantiacum TaxID=3236919 RepID=UPI001BDF2E01|nr:hypothetical protein [Curtobacterium flaccumfaciens]MBT1679176.1 hypothetical protein [Curtobacterium flaccumfaciens pv. flaccumfaciens]